MWQAALVAGATTFGLEPCIRTWVSGYSENCIRRRCYLVVVHKKHDYVLNWPSREQCAGKKVPSRLYEFNYAPAASRHRSCQTRAAYFYNRAGE